MRLLRFERKIFFALMAVAIAPLLAALFLGRAALRDTYGVGVNDQVRHQLEEGLAVYQDYFRARRGEAEATVEAIAGTLHGTCGGPGAGAQAATLLEAAAARYANVRSLWITRADGTRCAEAHAKGEASGAGDERTLTLTASLRPGPPRATASDLAPATREAGTLHVVVALEERAFRSFQNASEVVEVFRQLEARSDFLSGTYWALYVGALLLIIAVTSALAMASTRRVTKRIGLLADATTQVGKGDFSVAVPVRSRDEIAELSQAFNNMVGDLRDSRARIEYLRRISGWQEFARRLAHEIKNPLTPIQLAAQELERSFDGSDEKHRKALTDARVIIEEEVATLRRLVGEFSAFAKLPEVQTSPAKLDEFLEELTALPVSIEADLGGAVAIELQLPSPIPDFWVDLDGMLMRRCFDNLFRNAAEAARDVGQDKVALRVTLQERGPHVELTLEDSGPGVPEDRWEKVFQPHFSTKKEGSGLGLAIVKKIVLEHGGDITCDSVTGAGARFIIQLPTRAPP